MRRSGGLVAVAAMLAALATPISAHADTSPAATVISPTSGQVAGFVTVVLSGTVTAGADTAQRLQLYVDGSYKAEQSCLNIVACVASITWTQQLSLGSTLCRPGW